MLLLGGGFRRLFGRLLDAVLAIEPLDASRGIDQALCASVKRMALRADLDVKLFERRARFEGVAARTDDSAAAVFRMDSSFHFNFSNSSTYCIAGYHRKVSQTIRPSRLRFRAFPYRYRHLIRSNNNHDFRDCQLRRIFASEARTSANRGKYRLRARYPDPARANRMSRAAGSRAGRRVQSRFSIANSRSSANSRSIPSLVRRFSKSSTSFRLGNRR